MGNSDECSKIWKLKIQENLYRGSSFIGTSITGISQYQDWKKGAISSIFLKIIFSENAKEVDEEEQESVSSTAFKIPYGVRFEKRQVTQNMDH